MTEEQTKKERLELTPQEEKLILESRREKEQIQRRRENNLNVLKTAYLFEAWLQETGAGPTYSTFCDDFGYEGNEGEHRPRTYEHVIAVIGFVMNQ